MSEEQAIETDTTETDVIEQAEGAKEPEGEVNEEVEIVVAGEDEPTSKPHKTGFQKRVGRLNRKIATANTTADEATQRAQMLEEENKLLRLQAQQGKATARPNENDFDTDDEYQTALAKHNDARIESIAEEKAKEIVEARYKQTTQAQIEGNLDKQIDEHYRRSAKLNIPNYDELEAAAVDVLGDDIAKQIVAKTSNSEMLMAHLGLNPEKAQALKQSITDDPVKGVLELGGLASSLRVKPRSSNAPDPETRLTPGTGVSKQYKGPPGVTYE